jgi:hypothetical protein
LRGRGIHCRRIGHAVAAAEGLDQADVGVEDPGRQLQLRVVLLQRLGSGLEDRFDVGDAACMAGRGVALKRGHGLQLLLLLHQLLAQAVQVQRVGGYLARGVQHRVVVLCDGGLQLRFAHAISGAQQATLEYRQVDRRGQVEHAAARGQQLAHVDAGKAGQGADADIREEFRARRRGALQRGFDLPAACGDVGPARDQVQPGMRRQAGVGGGQGTRVQRRQLIRRHADQCRQHRQADARAALQGGLHLARGGDARPGLVIAVARVQAGLHAHLHHGGQALLVGDQMVGQGQALVIGQPAEVGASDADLQR